MRKTHFAFVTLILIAITMLTVSYSLSQTRGMQGQISHPAGWQTNPEWTKTKYGEWGGPGVDSRPGPMDNILLKDWAPKTSVVAPETSVAKAKYPAIDVHAHVNARTRPRWPTG